MLRYVALGDSTGTGVGAGGDGYPELLFQRLKAAGYPAGILNIAQSGATTREVVGGQVQKAVSKSPNLVTLGVGTNDLWKMVPVDTFRMNLKLIADALEKSGAEVIVSNITDLSLAPVAAVVEAFVRIPKAMFAARLGQLNEALGALARRPRFTVVDVYGQSRAELAGPRRRGAVLPGRVSTPRPRGTSGGRSCCGPRWRRRRSAGARPSRPGREAPGPGAAPPPERGATVRAELEAELRKGPASARDLSGAVGIREKDVADHLEHVEHSARARGERLVVEPASCADCGFRFEGRTRLTRPGACPECRAR